MEIGCELTRHVGVQSDTTCTQNPQKRNRPRIRRAISVVGCSGRSAALLDTLAITLEVAQE
jgi:hypothetical protein